jgi:hypothetical protein
MRNLVRAHPFLFYYVLALVIASLVTFITETWGKGGPAAAPASHYHYAVAHHMVTPPSIGFLGRTGTLATGRSTRAPSSRWSWSRSSSPSPAHASACVPTPTASRGSA